MASSNFEAALALVLKHEGGYADHPSDPGGATNLGITHTTLAKWRGQAVSKADVRALGRDEAGRIYRALYWDRLRAGELPSGLDLAVFDFAVNSGPLRAARMLQAILGVGVDGVVGPKTLAAARTSRVADVVAKLCDARLEFLQGLSHFAVFGRGWTARVRSVRSAASALVGAKTLHMEKETTSMLTATTGLLRSKVVWGAAIAIAAQAAAAAGITISAAAQAEITDIVLQVIGIGGAALALWGRLRGEQKAG